MERISSRYKVPKASALRLFLPAEMRRGKVRESYKKIVKVGDISVPIPKSAKKQLALLEYLNDNSSVAAFDYSALCTQFGAQAVKALETKGAIQIIKEKINRNPFEGVVGEEITRTLTAAQQSAVQSIETSPKRVHLIHGVTGSGKTEIYLRIIADRIQKGKTAIFLVPEISLTPQMLAQLRARFKGVAAILHSGLSAGEKFDEWWRLRTGEAKIAVGARSAIFAPLENIGAIIVDEEHEASYFSETAPRYSTLEIARMRAEYNDCKLILGSATPSVESYARAVDGEYNLITLTERVNHRPMPEIIIADMRKELSRGNDSAFSKALRDELQNTLDNGKQAIIFLNRRGYSQKIICRDCGYVAKCEHCDVTLTYHSEDDCLKCHYCGAKYRMLPACPECGGVHIRYSGTGTQRVVADLNSLFPKARILRMDNDTVSGKDGHYKILNKFSQKQADILVGTQMVAKGHDFPAVTLVGILDADMSLQFEDYRSGERTFQLITQVSGRSGRADAKGKVVLQSYCPENYVLRYAVNYDYLGFFQNEVRMRKATFYPPYALVCRIMVTSENEEKAVAALKEVYSAVESLKNSDRDEFIFLTRMRSPIKKIQEKYRFQVLMRLKSEKYLPEFYDLAVKHTSASVLVFVEENPSGLS
jgi:primosomal protein N' (replication factor Y)